MNTVVTTTQSPTERSPSASRLHEHPPQSGEHQRLRRRVGLLDRLALHVGVALVAWGRRPLVSESHERRANRREQHLALLGRELAAERMRYLNAPRW